MFLEGTESFISAILWTKVKIRVPLANPPLGKILKIKKIPLLNDCNYDPRSWYERWFQSKIPTFLVPDHEKKWLGIPGKIR